MAEVTERDREMAREFMRKVCRHRGHYANPDTCEECRLELIAQARAEGKAEGVREEFDRLASELGDVRSHDVNGCRDHSCLVGHVPKGGMGTNGRCRCEAIKYRRQVRRVLRAELARLEGEG